MKKAALYGCIFAVVAMAGTDAARRADLGINLSWPVDWNQQHIFADVMKTANGWEELFTNDPVPVDSLGWPTADGKCSMWFTDHMHGTYKLIIETRVDNSQVTIGASMAGASIEPALATIAHPAPNRTTADVVVTDSGTHLFTISFSNTKGGLKYVKLMRPTSPGSSTSYDTTTFLTDQFKKAVEPFSTLRFMQITSTNFNGQHTWSDRVAPDIASFNHNSADVNGRGISWECVIRMANDLHKDAWINVPMWVDENYIRQMALLFRNGNAYTDNKGFDPNLHLYVELSNEIWNYEQNENRDTALHEIKTHGDPDRLNYDSLTQEEASDGWEWAWRRPGAGTVKLSNIFRSVFGDSSMMTRVRPLLCWQAPRHATAWAPLVYIEKTQLHPVNYYIYGGGGSAYYSPDLGTPGLTLDNIWNSRSMDTSWWRDTWPDGKDKFSMLFNSYMCNVYGIKRLAYEGGPSFDPDQPGKNDTVMKQAWSDSRMRNEIVEHQNAWNNWAGDVLVYYVLNQGDFAWDFVKSVYDITAPKYKGIVDLAQAAQLPIAVGHPAGTTIDGNAFQLGYGDWRDTLGKGTAWRHKNAWVSYQFNIPTDGFDSAGINLSTPEGSRCRVDVWLDGKSIFLDTIPQNVTQNILTKPFALSSGLHSLRVDADAEGWVINTVRLFKAPSAVLPITHQPNNSSLRRIVSRLITGKTAVTYELQTAGKVTLIVYDLFGRKKTILSDEMSPAGTTTILLNGKNLAGRKIGGGVYFCQFREENGRVTTGKFNLF
jgi:hypothetical protein